MEKLKIRKRFYHGYSNGKKTGTLFMCKADYVEAMNRMAFCAAKYKGRVKVVAFCVMKTHVHVLLYGDARDCARFLEDYDMMTVRYMRRFCQKDIGELFFEMRDVTEGEGVKSEFSYILRNPTQAGIPYFPWEYPWGSGSLYYMEENWQFDVLDKGLEEPESSIDLVETLSTTAKAKIFHSTEIEIPGEWTIYKGVVLPSNYINANDNFAGFLSKKDYLYYIGKIRDDKTIDELIENNSNANVGVADLKSKLTKIFISKYRESGYRRVRDLPTEKRQALAEELHSSTNASLWMIAKATQLHFDEVVSAILEV